MPVPATGEVLVQVKAAAINPSDIKNVLGKMHQTTVPRIPGRDFAGIVVEGPASRSLMGKSVFRFRRRRSVFRRDGSHAAISHRPGKWRAASAVEFEFRPGRRDRRRVSHRMGRDGRCRKNPARRNGAHPASGTTGAVGSTAARIVHSRGARVIGTVRKEADIASAGKTLPVEAWINLATTDLAAGVRDATNGRGADVVFDVVGGQMFEKCLASLALRGRQVAISSSPDPVVSFNLVNFYHNESRLLGFDSLKLSIAESAGILRLIVPGFESGIFPPPQVETFPLDEGPRLYREMAASKIKGKPILAP